MSSEQNHAVTSQNPEMQLGLHQKLVSLVLEGCYDWGKSDFQATQARHKSKESSTCQCTANLVYKVI